MRLLQDAPTHNYYTDDPAHLYFAHSSEEKPDRVTAYRIGNYSVNTFTRTVTVLLDHIEYMKSAFFGPGRPCGHSSSTKWTGDAYKFAIYKYKHGFGNDIVIMRTDGGGSYFYVVDQSDVIPMFERLCYLLDEPLLWDMCIMLTKTYHAGNDLGRRDILNLFLDDRLKKRKKGGVTRVEILDVQTEEAAK